MIKVKVINVKQCKYVFSLILLSMTLSSCATVSRFIPDFTSAEAGSMVDTCADCTEDSGLHCYSMTQPQNWQCQDSAHPMEVLSLSDVGLQERSVAMRAIPAPSHQDMPKRSFVEPLYSEPLYSKPEPRINHKSREILNKPATFFTVQLLALSNEAALHKYAKNKRLVDPLYTQIDAKGQRLYVLLLGIYSDQLSAKRASQQWTRQGDRSAKPWIRVLGPLQNQIVLASR